MATLQEVRTTVDSFLADLWVKKIVPKEEEYFAKHGRYAQVLLSPNTPVKDGGVGTFSLRAPYYEKNIADFHFSIETPVPMEIEIHQHQRRGEFGFTAYAFVEFKGKRYRRSKNYKFGTVDIPWQEVIPLQYGISN